MKLMLASQCLELLAARETVLAEATTIMRPMQPETVGTDWLAYGVKEGWFNVTEITIDNRPALVVWYHMSADGGFIVNGAASVNPHVDQTAALYAGITAMAKESGSRYIEFTTQRRGLVEKTEKYGFAVRGVVLRKML